MQTYFEELCTEGFKPIPLAWDAIKKTGKPIIEHSKVTADTDCLPFANAGSFNGIAIKLFAPFIMIDFDLKNTEDKGIFDEWMMAINASCPDVLDKICIEQTRSGGYHVYARTSYWHKKTMLARSISGGEVISIYANSVLSFCYPTPGYNIQHGSMSDLVELTTDECELIAAISAHLDAFVDKTPQAKVIISYHSEYIDLCKAFDDHCTDGVFELLLNEMTLFEVKNYRYKNKDKHIAYRRQGSDAAFSAKVYWHSRKVLLFTTSIPGYPNHSDYSPERPGEWILTPTKIIYYRNGGDWKKAIAEIQSIAFANDIELPELKEKKTLSFPFHAFPQALQDSIREVSYHRSLPDHFVATSCIWAVSALAGNAYFNEKLPASENILYCLLVAPVSVGKTPSVKVAAFDPLKRVMYEDEQQFKVLLESWNAKKVEAANKKKSFADPRPKRYLPFLQDGTTESFVAIHMDQPNGIGVFYDEAETLFNAGNYKAINDSTTFLTTAFNGGLLNVSRADREKERVVSDININLIAGTQPDRLNHIFTADKIQAGFPARFLMVYSDYRELNTEADPFGQGVNMCREWKDTLTALYNFGKAHNLNGATRPIRMTTEAMDLYRGYFKQGLSEANSKIERREHPVIIGLGAKMSAYLMRITQILAIINNCDDPLIDAQTIKAGYDVYQYYFESTASLLMRSVIEAETGLNADMNKIFTALPDGKFTRQQAHEVCEDLGFKGRKFDDSMRSDRFKKLFKRISQGVYEKI